MAHAAEADEAPRPVTLARAFVADESVKRPKRGLDELVGF